MTTPSHQDRFPGSRAYLELQPLRIPSGWTIAWNELHVGLTEGLGGVGGSSLFNAMNVGRRFNIDIAIRPKFDPDGAFHLTVTYQPWPRTERGRRRKDAPFAFDADAEVVHAWETRSYPALVGELEHWIARCTVWTREGG